MSECIEFYIRRAGWIDRAVVNSAGRRLGIPGRAGIRIDLKSKLFDFDGAQGVADIFKQSRTAHDLPGELWRGVCRPAYLLADSRPA